MSISEFDLTETQELVVELVLRLPLAVVRGFLRSADIGPSSGSKEDIRWTISDALDKGTLEEGALVRFLNEVEPWTKQHAFLLSLSDDLAAEWAGRDFDKELAEARSSGLSLEPEELLPERMTIATARRDADVITVIAAETRIRTEKRSTLNLPPELAQELPQAKLTRAIVKDGTIVSIFFEAYAIVRTRGVLMFRWDLVSNEATVHISQGPTTYRYDERLVEFLQLLTPLLALRGAKPIDLGNAIRRIHENAESGNDEARPSRLGYDTSADSHVEARSSSATESLLNDPDAMTSMKTLRTSGAQGRGGTIIFREGNEGGTSPSQDTFVTIVAPDGRVNFTRTYPPADILHVLSRLRALNV